MTQQDLFTAETPSATEPDLLNYDRVLIAFSGGKDSAACVLHVLAAGVARDV